MCAAFCILRRREEGLQQSKSECVFSLPHSSPWLPNIIRVSLKLQDLLENVIIYLPTLPNSHSPVSSHETLFPRGKDSDEPGRGPPLQTGSKQQTAQKGPQTFRRASAGQHRQRSVAGIVHRYVRGEYQRSSNPTGTYSWKWRTTEARPRGTWSRWPRSLFWLNNRRRRWPRRNRGRATIDPSWQQHQKKRSMKRVTEGKLQAQSGPTGQKP